jgi:hypothetical protein
MTHRGATWAVGGFGLLVALVLAIGLETIGGVLALVQLGFLVGGLTAVHLVDVLRSRAAVVVLSVAMSVAVTAIAVQSLVWFRLATAESIVLTATGYGIVLATLLSSPDPAGAGGSRSVRGVDRW